jgi:hypothetical protein
MHNVIAEKVSPSFSDRRQKHGLAVVSTGGRVALLTVSAGEMKSTILIGASRLTS